MGSTQAELERSPDFWWLRFRYAIRDGRDKDAVEARRHLKALGVEVKPCKPQTDDRRKLVSRMGDST